MKIIFILLLLIPLQARWVEHDYQGLTSKTVHLTYRRAINERFKKMSDAQLAIYLKEASKVSKDHFGINLSFEEKSSVSVQELFSKLSSILKQELQKYIYDFKKGKGDKQKLQANLLQMLTSYQKHLPLKDMVLFTKEHLTVPFEANSIKAFAAALIQTELIRLASWTKVLAKDGQPVIDENPYNEWSYWDSLGYVVDDIDLIITNQLIASAEYYGQDIHSALRGGIVAGTTTFAKNRPYKGLVFATSFLFLNDDPVIKKLRGGKVYSQEEAARYAGAYLAHELGHLLLRLAHPFNRDACVMSPAKLLLFDQWYRNINAKECQLNSDASMTPGSVKLYYNDEW